MIVITTTLEMKVCKILYANIYMWMHTNRMYLKISMDHFFFNLVMEEGAITLINKKKKLVIKFCIPPLRWWASNIFQNAISQNVKTSMYQHKYKLIGRPTAGELLKNTYAICHRIIYQM